MDVPRHVSGDNQSDRPPPPPSNVFVLKNGSMKIALYRMVEEFIDDMKMNLDMTRLEYMYVKFWLSNHLYCIVSAI